MHRMLCAPRRRSLIWGLIVAALAAAAVAASAGAVPGGKPPVAPPIPTPPKADRDGNKVFDDFEAKIAGLQAGERVSVIVRLADPASQARLEELAQRVGKLDVLRRFDVVNGFAATLTKGQVEALTHVPWVLHVEENATVRALNTGARSAFGVTQARAQAPGLDGDADGSFATYSKDDLVVAVIDTGVDAAHPALDGGKVIAFRDYVNGRTTPYDDQGHGTHVAATIAGDAAGDGEGVAPGAAVVGVKVLDAAGNGSMANLTAGLDWVVANKDVYGIEVVNLSLGAAGCAAGTDATSLAVDRAEAAGLVVAVAAGNEGPGACTIGTPGAARGALTVGAMADPSEGGFSLASFSSRGPTADGRIKPDVTAPGVAITSAAANTGGYATYDGTSMATPFVAGVAALMRDANPALTPAQVKAQIVGTAVDWGRGGNGKTAGSRGTDAEYGSGRLDAYAAVAAAGAPLSSPPAAPAHQLFEGALSSTGASVSFKLGVSTTSAPLAVTMIHPGMTAAAAFSPDFDLYLYNPAGSLVAAAETSSRQETVSYQPTTTGSYTLRVVSYNGSGAFYADVSGAEPPAADTTRPTVTSVSPANGVTGAAAAANVTASFSEAMDTASTQSAFSLVRASDGAAVTGAFSWSGTTLTFNPSNDLATGTQYTARVRTTAKDVAGNALAAESVWSFTTAAAAVTTVVKHPTGTSVQTGSLKSGSYSRLAADDNSYYELNSSTGATRTTSWYARVTGVTNALKSLKITLRTKYSRTCTQVASVWRWTDSRWVQLDSRSIGTTETEVVLVPTGTLADYVSGSSGDGEVRVQLKCSTTSGTFVSSADLVRVELTK